MKPYKIIDNYCQLYEVTAPIIDYSETRFFVAISSEGATVLNMHGKSQLLGRVVCNAMKQGTVLYVHDGNISPLTWEKWKKTWVNLFTPKKREKAPEPNRTPGTYHSQIFSTMQHPRPAPKPQKHGFQRTEVANASMNLL